MCLRGASRVAAALQGLSPGAFRTFAAWIPVLPPDTEEAAEAAARSFPGALHLWDETRALAAHLGRVLGITAAQSIGAPGGPGLAWDVYLAYGPGRSLDTPPTFWMHQLAVTHAPRLEPAEFRCRLQRLLTP